MRNVVCPALLLAVASAHAVAGSATLDRAKLDRLGRLAAGSSVVVDGFPDGFGGTASVRFEKLDVYAPGARILVIDDTGEHEAPRSTRVQLIGTSASGDVRTSLSFDADGGHLVGVGRASGGTFVVSGERMIDGIALRAVPIESTYPPGVTPQILGNDDGLPTGHAQPGALEIALAGAAPAGTLRGAVVAVDTDNEFMTERFNNNTGAAANWIADLFATMNVMYERDLDVRLLQGTTMLRTATDPYVQDGLPAADQPDLVEFGSYWQTHYGNIPRAFAMLLSGKSSSGNSASGIAWINSYCENQSQGGSYSFNEVFTNPQVNVGLSALIVGHELGHNFGAFHTHCTNAATGAAPTGSNTIDKCYSSEQNCYSGATSCPSSGPGAPAGTIMSYCNLIPCGPTGQNVAQFHPTQINVLNTLIAQHTPSCLSPTVDVIFEDGFD